VLLGANGRGQAGERGTGALRRRAGRGFRAGGRLALAQRLRREPQRLARGERRQPRLAGVVLLVDPVELLGTAWGVRSIAVGRIASCASCADLRLL
jgi:hypothetical protein